jgi:hypothetical protein
LSQIEQKYFSELKNKIVAKMKETYPGIQDDISGWKGQEITDFQEELLKAVNAHISEKWFYTHMKSVSSRLPRIDVLNLLSKYAGYANWDDFVFRNRDMIEQSQQQEAEAPVQTKAKPDKANRYFLIIPASAVIILLFFFGFFKVFNTREYQFCFYDADTREPIRGAKIQVQVLADGESPVTGFCNSEGCYNLKTDKSLVRLVVSTPYYHTDTLVRVMRKLQRKEIVNLRPNDYAMMIHYLSQTKTADWVKRRARLEGMFDDEAMIYQVSGAGRSESGVDVLNKEEFIDKLTMPSASLKNIDVLDTKYRSGKIILLRYRVRQPL